jgi:hypothetical protein
LALVISHDLLSAAAVHQLSSVGEPQGAKLHGIRRDAVTRPPLPPFTRETAIQKVRLGEDAWYSRDPEEVSLASINDFPIRESDRKYHWVLGRRPDEHPGLSELDL